MTPTLSGFEVAPGQSLPLADPGTTAVTADRTLARFSRFPTFMGCVDTPSEEDLFSEMIWVASGERGPAEVLPLLPSDIVYRSPHNDSVGSTWAAHHEAFGRFVAHHAAGDLVYEVGAGHGILSLETNRHRTLHWTMHDLAPNPVRGYSGAVIQGLFTSRSAQLDARCLTIVHSHTLEHVHDPAAFMDDIAQVLPVGGRLIFSWPNMDQMLRAGDLNFLNFEHTVFLPQRYVRRLVRGAGFAIDAEESFRTHSLFVSATKVRGWGKAALQAGDRVLSDPEAVEFEAYFESLAGRVERMNAALQGRGTDADAWVFGAHVFTQMLIAAGLDVSRVRGCLDNSRLKEGRRLYGTNLMVQTPEAALATPNRASPPQAPLIVLAVAGYHDEIHDQLMDVTRGRCEVAF